MQAYHNDPLIKATYVARVKAHQLADEIVQGHYWQNGKGCAVGCTLHSQRGEHHRYETELGIPRPIAYLQDRIFEGLPNAEAKIFPLAFLEAIPVGADLSLVVPRFMVWLLADEQDGVIRFVQSEQGKAANAAVVGLYQRMTLGETISAEEWSAARKLASDAYDAADDDASDAEVYAVDAAADAAEAAAETAEVYAVVADRAAVVADRAAAEAAADACASDADAYAAADAARKAHYQKMRDKLLELLQSAPTPVALEG